MQRLLCALVLLAAASLAPSAGAQLLGDTRVGFSADRTVSLDGRVFTGRIYAMPGRQRHEQDIQGISQVILLRGDGRAWLVVPSMRSYVEFGLAPAFAELGDPSLLRTPVGQEVVSGVRTTKYRVEHTARDGTMVDGYIWRSADGVIMKLDGFFTPRSGKATPVQMQLSNVRTGAQDAALFEPPQGMMKLPSAALQPLLGVGPSGG